MKYHGSTGGKKSGLSELENKKGHKEWIVDVLLRLICVLSLDRFGDFVSDQVHFLYSLLPSTNLHYKND